MWNVNCLEIKWFIEVLCRHLSNKLRQILQWRMVGLPLHWDKQVDNKNKAVEETNCIVFSTWIDYFEIYHIKVYIF